MKRAISVALFGLAAGVLGGCPIYSDQRDHRVCNSTGCYDCPDTYLSNECAPWQCNSGSDCPSGFACNSANRCEAGDGTPPRPVPPPGGSCSRPSDCAPGQTCGADKACHTQDCSVVSCPTSYVCTLSNGVAKCVERGTQPAPTDGGTTPRGECNRDSECASTPGAKCLNGACVKPADQCTDTTQCAGGSQCVEGVCTPSCGASTPCPTGYQCDDARGVCSKNPAPCTADTQCANNTTCVSGRCVGKCTATTNTCSGGLVCVNGGCIPDQRPTFACNKDGTKSEGAQDSCKLGSICLRRSCYITCDADGGVSDAGAGTCRSADAFNVCKAVPTASGTFAVCSTANGLGTECGPTMLACPSSKICIDGLCR